MKTGSTRSKPLKKGSDRPMKWDHRSGDEGAANLHPVSSSDLGGAQKGVNVDGKTSHSCAKPVKLP